VIHPLCDRALGEFPSQHHKPARVLADLLLLGALPAQAFLLVEALRYPTVLGMISVGISGGAFAITVAHELVHRPKKWERAWGILTLSLVGYAHFRVEHVYGHHRLVATPEDPASARRDEGVYAFWWRSITRSFVSSWKLQSSRPWRSNRTLRCFLTEAAIIGLVVGLFGVVGLGIYALQSLVAILLLETVNYIEHYGLARKRLANGGYESVGAQHSWDSNQRLTNWTLFNLGLHAKHHLSAALPFPELEALPKAPRLPVGYSAALVLALFPPLWRRVMNPLIPLQ
jgi:alkane 1-monooxygenase